jgi:hypothetical protein
MANHHRPSVSSTFNFLTLARINARRGLALLTTLTFSAACIAQDQAQQPSAPEPQTNQAPAAPPAATETIPAGTRFALVLTSPVSSNTTHRGDEIQAQTTAPVTIGDHVVVPAGVFVQGTVDRLTRRGSRGEMLLESAKVIFPDGYVANLIGPLTIESEEGTAWRVPGGRAASGAFIAPFAGLGLGALIGSAAHTTQSSTLGGTTITSSTPKGIAIGSTVGMAAGAVVAIVLLAHSRQFFVDVGAPMEMTLPQPVTMSQSQVEDAVREAQEHPVAVPMPSPRPMPAIVPDNTNRGTCFTPGTPGTPDTVIPGMTATAASPGTPSTVIPGIPATPPTPYLCP